MIVIDANVLLYAVNEDSARHEATRPWLDAALAGAESVGLAWVALLAFVRISTNPRIYPDPVSPAEAMDQVQVWLGAPAAVVVQPTSRHAGLLRDFLAEAGTGGNLTTDAHLAALAVEHRAQLVSFDRDFQRFPGLRHRLPG